MPEKRDVAVLSITGIDVVLPIVPSFAHHVVGTHSRQGNTGRPHSEAALLESKLDGSWIANPEAFSCCCMLRPHSPALGPGPGFWQIRLGTPGALLRRASLWGWQRGERESGHRDANGGSRRSKNNAGYGWYPAECPEHRSAHQSPIALEQRIMGQRQGCRCCFESSPLKLIVCHIT